MGHRRPITRKPGRHHHGSNSLTRFAWATWLYVGNADALWGVAGWERHVLCIARNTTSETRRYPIVANLRLVVERVDDEVPALHAEVLVAEGPEKLSHFSTIARQR